MPEQYRNFLNDHLDFWNLQGLTYIPNCYTEDIIRIFYANLEFTNDEEGDRLYASGYMFGKEFEFDAKDINEHLERPNEGVKVYLNKKWPSRYGTYEEYHQWFGCWRNQKIGSLSSTELPALHRVLFIIISNFLIPKRLIKTNVEMTGIFFLRHWLQKDIQINVGAIILEHMFKVAHTGNDSLPYGSLISAFFLNDAIDFCPSEERIKPIDLDNLLTSYGWILTEDDELIPNPADLRNSYLFQTGAAPNQYEPVGTPVHGTHTAGTSASSSGLTNPDLMAYLTDQFSAINTNIAGINTKMEEIQNSVKTNFERMDTRFNQLEQNLTEMDLNLHNFWGCMDAHFQNKGGDSDDGEE